MSIGATVSPQVQTALGMFKQTGQTLSQGKWAPFMEGIEDPWIRSCTAVLLENQDAYLKQLHETTLTYSPGIATFEKFAFRTNSGSARLQ